jgi:DNA-binding PadR family transcriptional regulator
MSNETRQAVLTPAMFHILLALADGNRHGLGIVREVERRTQGEVRLGPGTLYGSIKKLLAHGHIEEPGRRPRPEDDDPRRRYYRISRSGRKLLEAEAARMDRLVRVAREKEVLKGSVTP